jgi:sulfate transport system substrate-binding protein
VLATIADSKQPIVLTVASFAVTKLAYVRLTKAFKEQYVKDKGVDVRFRLAFAGSGVQVGAA